ncbi:MAG: hypothetical protein S4CHLAM123_03080 [Chlamydiales bacterium]|nr:hypothetical protein [Chlamydiales bacterium]
MATSRTPIQKRAKRAEQGREEWKSKATLRRLENIRYQAILNRKKDRLLNLNTENEELKDKLTSANKTIRKQEELIESLKKTL